MTEKVKDCPIPSTHDKYVEAYYFLKQMVKYYHYPNEFRFNLNAFIQALRNITFILQSEDKKPFNFDSWYKHKKEEMSSNEMLRGFVEARNVLVKQNMLNSKTKIAVCVFKGLKQKVSCSLETNPYEISTFAYNEKLLDFARESYIGVFLDKEHSTIGDQLGIYREWVVDEIGDAEIVSICIKALNYMGELVKEVHELQDEGFEPYTFDIDMNRIQILLESDLDPNLPKKWGWE